MSTDTHTRWTIDECPDAQGFATIRLYDGSPNGNIRYAPVATAYSDTNARLIAAAPDLLSAAEEALRVLETLTTEDFGKGRDYGARQHLETAIRKARGQA